MAQGAILYTSRNRDVSIDLVGCPINVPPLTSQEARLLLGERTRSESTEAEQELLLTELDYLPLAITQAASYMKKRRKTVSQYLQLFQGSDESRIRLLGHTFVDIGRETSTSDSVSATWLISFRYIKSENPGAAELLFLMSLMDRESIPDSLLKESYTNPIEFDEAVGILETYSFITGNDSGTSFGMHRLVQIATRAWLSDQGVEKQVEITSRVIQALSSNFPSGEVESWGNCVRYLPHAESVLSRSIDFHPETGSVARAKLLTNVSWYLEGQGNYLAARSKIQEALDIYTNLGVVTSAEFLKAKRKLAVVVEQQGAVDRAIEIFRETLEAQETLLGKSNLDTLETIDDLALALAKTVSASNWAEAEELARSSSSKLALVLPENHPKR